MTRIQVEKKFISIIKKDKQDYICLTDMLKAKDGNFLLPIGCEIEIRWNF